MNSFNFIIFFAFILYSCSISLVRNLSENEKNNIKIYEKAVLDSSIDSVLRSNNIIYMDSQMFIKLIDTQNCRILTHSFSPTCSLSSDVLDRLQLLKNDNDSICPILIIVSPSDLDYVKLNSIIKATNVRLYFQNTAQFNYFKYLKKRFKIEKPELLYIMKNGKLLMNTSNVKDI